MSRVDLEEPVGEELPELLARVAETCGGPAALSLAQAFGGREIYIPGPEAIGETHPLAQALGLGCARVLAQALGRGEIIVPMGPTTSWKRQKVVIRRLLSEGRPHSFVAAAAGVHLRTVERYAQRFRVVAAEPDLFG